MVIYTDDYEPSFVKMMELDLVKVKFSQIGRAYKILFIKNRQVYEIITRDTDTYEQWF